jgi:hypothetical protein
MYQQEWRRILAKIIVSTIPGESALHSWSVKSDFCDAYEVSLPMGAAALSPTEFYLHASRTTPRWINTLMRIRNRIVRLFGLKDVGPIGAVAKAAHDYQVGDQIGIFSIFGKTENELLLGIDDRHLDVRVSVMKSFRNGLPYCIVSTAVQVDNFLGHLYMVPVGRIHPFIVRSMLTRGG